jgi:branched-chain amino acid transport system permease protein
VSRDIALQTLIEAVTIGSLYGLVGVSFNVIARPTGVLNFAQGDIVLIGAALAYVGLSLLSLPWLVALLLVAAAGMAFGLVEERVAIWPVLRRASSAHGWVLSTLAVSILVQNVVGLGLGEEPLRVPAPSVLSAGTRELVGSVRLAPYQVGIWVACWGLAGLLYLFYRTKHGRAIRALAEDRDAALLRGVNATRLVMVSFALGAALAAMAGMIAAPITFATPTMSNLFLFKGFEAAAIGGLGDNRGAMLGGLVVGVAEAFAGQVLDTGYRDVATFAVFLLILFFRPVGLFGKATLRQI